MNITIGDPIGPNQLRNIFADDIRVGFIRNVFVGNTHSGRYTLTDRTGFNFSSVLIDDALTNIKVFPSLTTACVFAIDYFSTVDIDAWTRSGLVR